MLLLPEVKIHAHAPFHIKPHPNISTMKCIHRSVAPKFGTRRAVRSRRIASAVPHTSDRSRLPRPGGCQVTFAWRLPCDSLLFFKAVA